MVGAIIYSALTTSAGDNNKNIQFLETDFIPGTQLVANTSTTIPVYKSFGTMGSKSVKKKITTGENFVVSEIPKDLDDHSYSYFYVKFSKDVSGWVDKDRLNEWCYPAERASEQELLVSLDNLMSLKTFIIILIIASIIIVGLYYFFGKINSVFVKNSSREITTPQSSWFYLSSIIIGIYAGYLFVFYRGQCIHHLLDGNFLFPSGKGITAWMMFLCIILFIVSVAVLAYQSVKQYGTNTGVKRAAIFSLLMLLIAVSSTAVTIATIWIALGVFLIMFTFQALGDSLSRGDSSAPMSARCPICGQVGSHGTGCSRGGAFNQYNGQTANNSQEYNNMKN
jgi:hypothetical protein